MVLSLMICETSLGGSLGERDFFEQRYRGWLWFDENEEVEIEDGENLSELTSNMPGIEEMERAKEANEKFSRELELLKHLMVHDPGNLENIKLYKLKEKEMMEKSATLGRNWLLVNFLNPEIMDELKFPQNIYGRDLRREDLKREMNEKIRSLKDRIEIFVFRREGCSYCVTLEEHLARFAMRYGFEVEAVSEDGSESEFFKTNTSSEIVSNMIDALGLEVMPTVIVVVKETRERFELARGAVSVSELEEKVGYLFDVLEMKNRR